MGSLSQLSGPLLGSSGVITIAAMATGGMTGLQVARMDRIIREMEGRTPSPEELAEMQRISTRLRRLGRTTATLLLIVIGAMASTRFV